jgi:hypothetical protein
MNDNFVKVEGFSNLQKDLVSGVVINTDKAGYEQYLAQAALNAAKREQILTMEQEVDNIKEDIKEIKQLIKYLIEKK